MQNHDPQTSYDRVAEEYARQMLHELDHKPRDRELLDQFAARVQGKGRVADLGTGPGQVARYLHDRGVDAFGIDLAWRPKRIAAGRLAGARQHSADGA